MLTNLLVFLEDVTNYVDSGYPVDIIYLDFQKAFDKVPHKLLLHKLAAHGIRETAVKPKMVLPPSEQHCLGGGVRALTAF